MYVDIKKVLSIAALLIAGAFVGIVGILAYQKANAPKQTITVTGSAEVDAVTDQANISAQVRNGGSTQELALAANKKDVAALKKKLLDLGIPETRITQSSYTQSMYPDDFGAATEGMSRPEFSPPPNNSTIPTAVTNLTVTLDSIGNVSDVISAISESPNTRILNTYYSLNHRQEWEAKAKEAALKDARRQIEQIAKTNKLRVGKLTFLRDMNEGGYDIMPAYREKQGVMAPEGTTSSEEPIDTGVMEDNVFYSEQSVKITAAYQARYELY